ncbi:MAG: SGNH/GDSL hydrolase family protein [Chlamydiae bacterium]|nr:SGNH/GDSL hydrolase family protein [Chlamydiota bacterium]MBI3276586.1 SGNH/GDSL hydrolase family protein [Chlamydiota bacterium]
MKKYLWTIFLGSFFWVSVSVGADVAPSNQWSVWSGSDGSDTEIYYARKTGDVWSKPERLNQDNAVSDVSPAMALDKEGRAFVVWVRKNEDRREVYISKWDGEKWSPEEEIGGSSNLKFSEPSVAIDEEGQIWVVACGVKEGQDEIYWTSKTSLGWSSWSRLNAENNVPDLDPTILAFNHKVWVVWNGFYQEGYELFFRVWDQGSWGSQAQLFPLEKTAGSFPSLMLKDGKPNLLFYRDGKVFSSQKEGDGWTKPFSIPLSLESIFLDVWKNQGVVHTQSVWYQNERERGSQIILLDSAISAPSRGQALAWLKKFLKVNGSEAWAATNANVYSAFGDSITSGFPEDGSGGYPSRLQGKLTSKFGASTVVNRGVGGERTVDGLSRINSVLSADNPEFILIMEGTNDAGDERSPESITFNLGEMVNRAIAFGTRPVVSTITPRLDNHNGNVENTNSLIRGLAGSKGATLVDNYAAISSKSNFESLYTDHVHFNGSGYEILAQTWFSGIEGIKGGGGGGGCGTVQPKFPDKWNLNLEPLLFLTFVFLMFKGMRRWAKV